MKRYLVVIEQAEGNLSAYSPDLPGCIATGKSREDVEANMRAAIQMHIRGLQEDGLAVPEPTTVAEYVTV
jgi:predicted RNase H-like HicB family nuclease